MTARAAGDVYARWQLPLHGREEGEPHPVLGHPKHEPRGDAALSIGANQPTHPLRHRPHGQVPPHCQPGTPLPIQPPNSFALRPGALTTSSVCTGHASLRVRSSNRGRGELAARPYWCLRSGPPEHSLSATNSPLRPTTDVVNSASFHPFLPLAATATGERKYVVKLKNFDDEVPREESRATDAPAPTVHQGKGKEKESIEEEEAEEEEVHQQQNELALWCQLAQPAQSGA
jgi:hypothetical protein